MNSFLTGKLKTGPKNFHTYTISHECPVCMAVDQKGKSLRLIIDKYLISHSPLETKRMLEGYGVIITESPLKTHMKKHSRFIEESRKLVQETAKKLALTKLDSISETYADPDEVIQEVINIGAMKIRSGELEVDTRLLLGALKEQGQRKKVGTIRDLMENLDKQRFGQVKEAEVVEKLEQ